MMGGSEGRRRLPPFSRRRQWALLGVAIIVLSVLVWLQSPYTFSILAHHPTGAKNSVLTELPNELAFLDANRCHESPSLKRCGQAEVIHYLQGTLETRLYSMCMADAYSRLSGAKLRMLWKQDGSVQHAKFSDLLVMDEADVHDAVEEFTPPPSYTEIKVKSSVCSKPSNEDDWEQRTVVGVPWPHPRALPPVTIFVAPWLKDWQGWEEPPSCELQVEVGRCFQGLRPAETVEDLMAHENMPRLRRSSAVYVQAPFEEVTQTGNDSASATSPHCSGCPDKLLNCTIRRLAMAFLRDPSQDFTVVGDWAADAVAVSQSFVLERAPLLFSVTGDRQAHCPLPPPRQGTPDLQEGKLQGLGAGGQGLWRHDRRDRHAIWRALKIQERMSKFQKAQMEGMDENVRRKMQSSLRMRQKEADTVGPLGNRLRMRRRRRPLEPEGTGRKLLEEEERDEVLAEGLKSLQSIRCLQYQLAELFLLTLAKGFIYSYPSSATEFLAARMLPYNAAFTPEETICDSPPIKPIKEQRFAAQFYIDENLKAIYCSIPKVACTSWKVWFRQVAGLPNPGDAWIVHNPAKSGLKELWWSYSEADAIRVVTRPDMFKFTFIRNPFSRTASVYFDKHVNGGPPYTRRHWNRKFFGYLPQLRFAGNRELSLEEFVNLVEVVMGLRRSTIEPHIAPQLDLCSLDAIKYDFVGRFEELAEDLKVVMARLGTEPMSAFKLGKKDHPTQADDRLLSVYNQRVYDKVKEVYNMDFEIPFNNISYKAPDVLKRLYGRKE